jgi:hypothetical protein
LNSTSHLVDLVEHHDTQLRAPAFLIA